MKSTVKKKKYPELSGEMGIYFKQMRVQHRLTKTQVAGYIGDISEATLSLYESGQKQIPLCDIYALANCLNIAPSLIQELMQSRVK